MKKKVLSTLLVASMVACLFAGCTKDSSSSANKNSGSQNASNNTEDTKDPQNEDPTYPSIDDYGSGEIVIWVADKVVDLTKQKAEEFLKANEAYSGYTVRVEAVGEGDAAKNVLTDVAGAGDIFGFAQDQLTRLVSAGALLPLAGAYDTYVKNNNDAGAVSAAKVGDQTYAFPVTSDNGYFLYYDKSVVTDPTSLEKVVADCEAAGKNFYMEINSGWYQTSFFFATGCELTYETNDEGKFVKCNINYNSDAGLVALKEMIELASSKSFQNGSSAGKAVDAAAIVTGTWDKDTVMGMFGDNYACTKLPSFKGSDGKDYQLSGFGGFKLLGVKPQEEQGKALVCLALAEYLSSEEVQMERFNSVGWGPSNLKAQQNEAVQNDPALSALAAQLAYTIPQGQYPDGYWTRATALGDECVTKNINKDTSDDDLKAMLDTFQKDCESYATAE